jgi:uncharacterized protein (TIGR02271 family)
MEENKIPNQEQGRLNEHGKEVTVIPVIEEHLTIDREVIETAKVFIRKRVVEEEQLVNMPLIQEGFDIERVPVKKVVDTMPVVRQEGDTVIIPVVREVLVIEKRYEIIEEVHVVKSRTAVPHMQQITLLKEQVHIDRVPINPNHNPPDEPTR